MSGSILVVTVEGLPRRDVTEQLVALRLQRFQLGRAEARRTVADALVRPRQRGHAYRGSRELPRHVGGELRGRGGRGARNVLLCEQVQRLRVPAPDGVLGELATRSTTRPPPPAERGSGLHASGVRRPPPSSPFG